MEEETINIDVKEDSSLSELLLNWRNINKIKKDLVNQEDRVKNKIKIFLKENKWDKHTDETTNITVSIIQGQTESFDKSKLRILLSESQYNQVRKVTTYEKMMIMTADDRERMKKILKTKK